MKRKIFLLGLLLVCIALPAMADSRRAITLMVGTLAPSGSSAPYADGGIVLAGRMDQTVQSHPALRFWAEADVQVLNENSSIYESGGVYSNPIPMKLQSNVYAGMAGLQLGSPSQRAFIRPRAAVGLGVFAVETRKTLVGGSSASDTTGQGESVEFKIRPGIKVNTGLDFFFNSGWGIGVEFFWEDIFALRSADPRNNVSGSVQFQGASFCVVFPLGRK